MRDLRLYERSKDFYLEPYPEMNSEVYEFQDLRGEKDLKRDAEINSA
jgi:hypothetical protein